MMRKLPSVPHHNITQIRLVNTHVCTFPVLDTTVCFQNTAVVHPKARMHEKLHHATTAHEQVAGRSYNKTNNATRRSLDGHNVHGW